MRKRQGCQPNQLRRIEVGRTRLRSWPPLLTRETFHGHGAHQAVLLLDSSAQNRSILAATLPTFLALTMTASAAADIQNIDYTPVRHGPGHSG